MTPADFQDLVDRYGDRLADWPEAHRDEAQALLAVSEPARQVLAASQRMRGLFASATRPASGSRLSDRILRAAGLDPVDAEPDRHMLPD